MVCLLAKLIQVLVLSIKGWRFDVLVARLVEVLY